MSSPDPGNGRGGGGSQGACAESWFPGRRLWSGKSRLAPGVRRRTQRSPSCRRAGSRAGLGAGPGARLNEEGRFACHSGLAAVPLLPSPLSCEGHAAQHRVRGQGGGSRGRRCYPAGAGRLGEAAARAGTPVRGGD